MAEQGGGGQPKSCQSCGKPLASNPECETCMKHLVEQGSESVTEEQVEEAAHKGATWLARKPYGAAEKLVRSVQALVWMIKDYLTGEYKETPWTVIAAGTFAVLYVVDPFDLIPDFIPFLGYIDDLFVVYLVLRAIELAVREYLRWRGTDPDDFLGPAPIIVPPPPGGMEPGSEEPMPKE